MESMARLNVGNRQSPQGASKQDLIDMSLWQMMQKRLRVSARSRRLPSFLTTPNPSSDYRVASKVEDPRRYGPRSAALVEVEHASRLCYDPLIDNKLSGLTDEGLLSFDAESVCWADGSHQDDSNSDILSLN